MRSKCAPCAGARRWVGEEGCSRGCWQRVGAAGLLSSASAPVFLDKTRGHAGQGCHRGWWPSPGLRSRPFAGEGLAVVGSIACNPHGAVPSPTTEGPGPHLSGACREGTGSTGGR